MPLPSAPPALPPFAERYNRLLETIQPGGVRQTDEMVAQATEVSAQYIGMLRTGKRTNPGHELVGRIAAHFGVDVGYFLDPDRAAAVDKELRLLGALRDSRVRRLAHRMSGLSAASLDLTAEIIERLRRLEGLPDTD
ncbi:XRE family transcriptional regulator [Catellatospora sp. TT07R-123]|uniref:helix-turn-helix domain-containing protein n=1 Tax=Catellatospora sp. TT07R-123 TaxID=2733863 RepID=UPI001B0EBF58|nr:helix-turn-helix domain-containing protein [Catellatospora sp. TT07R-123]GHJ48106.1 XRE family transcriptional regulator [Catellatospora sp. TT07R-123]